mgnify:CR=1 FL=1
MKKFVALLLAVLMVASLCACGQKDTQTGSDIKTVTAGKLTMSTNAQFPPYESVADDGKGYEGTGFEGIDIEIAYALAQKLGLELVVDDMDFDSALSAVQTGKSDIVAAGVTVTPELIKEVKPDHVIVATGAHFVAPNIPGLDTAKDVYVAEDVLAGKAMPHGETIILGGGGVGCETAQFLIEHGVTDVRVMDSKRVGNKMGMLRTMFLDIEYPGETIKKSRGSKITAVGDHEITYAFTNKAKKTVEKTRHFDSLVIATGMHSRPTQELTDACSELGIPCDVIGSAKKADMGIEATADAYAAAMNV